MRSRAPITGMAVTAVAVLAAGCGGSSPGTTVANVGSTPATASAASSNSAPGSKAAAFSQALKFSQCMRSHGITDFPDPQQRGNGMTLRIQASPTGDLNPGSTPFQAAQTACRAYAPPRSIGGPANPRLAQQALAFSQCMRSHGVPNFPDPKVSGNQVQLGGPGPQGFDPNSPQFQAAQKACQRKLLGAGGGGSNVVVGGGSSGK